MRRREFIAGLGAAAAWPAIARAQPKRPLIGWLFGGGENANAPWVGAFSDGMRELGYVRGQDYEVAVRTADDDYTKLTALAQQLVSLRPAVIVAAEPVAAVAVKQATSSVPIVAPILVDPVRTGLIASEARPGSNLTGLLVVVPGFSAKVFEVAHDLFPDAAAIGMLLNPTNASMAIARRDIETGAKAKGVKIIVADAAAPADLPSAFAKLSAAKVRAVLLIADPMYVSERERIVALATAARLPIVSSSREFVEAGALVNYGVSLAANQRRAAYFVDKILKGAKPADLPVEFPTKIEMVVNLKAAKALGIAIPQSFLLRADEVIE